MIYLNIQTEQRTEEFISPDITIPIDSPMVQNFFKPLPESEDGTYKREWSDTEGYIFTLTPNPTQAELDAISLQQAKAKKIAEIDAQTALSIEALVGDNNKQKDLLAERSYLLERKFDGIIEPNEQIRLDELKDLWLQISSLKYTGNDRENIVALVEITTTLENAIAEIEAI